MSNVHIDPHGLRQVAERILGDKEFDYKPELDDIRRRLQPELNVMSNQEGGFVYGIGQIGGDHDTCLKDVILIFNNIERGFVAVSNMFASVSEDFTETDLDSDASIKAIYKYFTPPETGYVPR